MKTSPSAKVFMNVRSQAIRLPKEFRVKGPEVRLTRVPEGILVSEADPWERFRDGCEALGDDFFKAMEERDRSIPQKRDFSGGLG
jgi:antitoxin VapB